MNLSAASGNLVPGQDLSVPSLPVKPPVRIASILLIVLLWVTIYVAGMFTPALLDDVDTVHAEAAREMLLRHDWVTLYTNGIRYLEKAPLLYWSMATSMGVAQLLRHTSANC